MEIYGLINDSQIFENFSKEMYITKSKFKKWYEFKF
jgi:hypothetical protein